MSSNGHTTGPLERKSAPECNEPVPLAALCTRHEHTSNHVSADVAQRNAKTGPVRHEPASNISVALNCVHTDKYSETPWPCGTSRAMHKCPPTHHCDQLATLKLPRVVRRLADVVSLILASRISAGSVYEGRGRPWHNERLESKHGHGTAFMRHVAITPAGHPDTQNRGAPTHTHILILAP